MIIQDTLFQDIRQKKRGQICVGQRLSKSWKLWCRAHCSWRVPPPLKSVWFKNSSIK